MLLYFSDRVRNRVFAELCLSAQDQLCPVMIEQHFVLAAEIGILRIDKNGGQTVTSEERIVSDGRHAARDRDLRHVGAEGERLHGNGGHSLQDVRFQDFGPVIVPFFHPLRHARIRIDGEQACHFVDRPVRGDDRHEAVAGLQRIGLRRGVVIAADRRGEMQAQGSREAAGRVEDRKLSRDDAAGEGVLADACDPVLDHDRGNGCRHPLPAPVGVRPVVHRTEAGDGQGVALLVVVPAHVLAALARCVRADRQGELRQQGAQERGGEQQRQDSSFHMFPPISVHAGGNGGSPEAPQNRRSYSCISILSKPATIHKKFQPFSPAKA